MEQNTNQPTLEQIEALIAELKEDRKYMARLDKHNLDTFLIYWNWVKSEVVA